MLDIEGIAAGLSVVLQFRTVAFMVVGVLIGIMTGIIPGPSAIIPRCC